MKPLTLLAVLNFSKGINLEHFITTCWQGHMQDHMRDKFNHFLNKYSKDHINPDALFRFLYELDHQNLSLVEDYILENHTS